MEFNFIVCCRDGAGSTVYFYFQLKTSKFKRKTHTLTFTHSHSHIHSIIEKCCIHQMRRQTHESILKIIFINKMQFSIESDEQSKKMKNQQASTQSNFVICFLFFSVFFRFLPLNYW